MTDIENKIGLEDFQDFGLEAFIKYPQFWRLNVVRTYARLDTPRVVRPEDYVLPKGSIIHYIPESAASIGIEDTHYLMRNSGQRMYIRHIESMDINHGTARELGVNLGQFQRQYHKKYRQWTRVRNLEMAMDYDRIHMVVNYALLQRKYRYIHSQLVVKHEYQNVRDRMWKEVAEMGSQRYQFIPVSLPKVIPTRMLFKQFTDKFILRALKVFNTTEAFDLMDIYKICQQASILEKLKKEGATLHPALLLDPEVQEITHFTFYESGAIITLKLKDMIDWCEQKGLEGIKKMFRLWNGMTSLRGIGEIVTSEEGETVLAIDPEEEEPEEEVEEEVFEVVDTSKIALGGDDDDEEEEEIPESDGSVYDVVEPTDIPSRGKNMVEHIIKDKGEAGLLTGPEIRAYRKLAEKSSDIKSPVSDDLTIAEEIIIDPEVLLLTDDKFTSAAINTPNKEILSSSLTQLTTRYVKEVYKKDVVNALMAPQSAGIIIKDIKRKDSIDAVTKKTTYTVSAQPVGGKSTQLMVTVPMVEEDGTFLSEGITYRMDYQKSDAPITKISPHMVGLSSYYGTKVFVIRNQNASTNWSRWIVSQLKKRALNPADTTVTNIKYGDSKHLDVSLPRQFTAIGETIHGWESGEYTFIFDYNRQDKHFKPEWIKEAKSKKLVLCGFTGKKPIGMDKNGYVRLLSEKQPRGFITKLIDEDMSEGPMEYTEMSIFSTRVPVILALSYLYGLENALKRLRIRYTVVGVGERVEMDANVLRLKFKNEHYLVNVSNPEHRLMMAGFNSVKSKIGRFTSADFNKRNIYLSLLSGGKINQSHLRELIQMNDMFIDHITLGELKRLKEPETFSGLLIRSNELLIDDYVPSYSEYRIKGYERVAGFIYSRMVESVRKYRARGNHPNAELSLKPSDVWLDIVSDQSVEIVEDSNPFHNIKEKEVVTYSGKDGRSDVSMVKDTRGFNANDLGVFSEATPDSQKVAIRTYMSGDPNIVSLRGQVVFRKPNELKAVNVLSSTALYTPAVTHDDGKRGVFTNIQASHIVSCPGYETAPFRTDYDTMIGFRVDDKFATKSTGEGKVVKVTDDVITIAYKSGEVNYELGMRHGNLAGSAVPHVMVTDLKLGDKVSDKQIVTFVDGFFQRDLINKNAVSVRASKVCTVAFVDGPGTYEDGFNITNSLQKEFSTTTTHIRPILIPFDSHVYDLIKVGTVVDSDSILCTLENSLTGDFSESDAETVKALSAISASNPKAGSSGVITRIEVFYCGELENMTPTLAAVVKDDNRIRASRSRMLDGKFAKTGQIARPIRVGGTKMVNNSAVIKIYIDEVLGYGAGDKFVIGSQLKTTVSEVLTDRLETESGKEVHAETSYQGAQNRVVLSYLIQGLSNRILKHGSLEMANIYFNK